MREDESARIVACIPRLRAYARALVGERSRADDLVQDTLARACDRLALWRRGMDMRAWLFSIMHNLHIDQLRKSRVVTQPLDDEAFDAPVRATHTDMLEVADLDAALRELPIEQREVLLLVALEQMTYQQVAETLGIPLGTVMSRLSRGRERLRAMMEGRSISSPLRVVK